MHVAVCVPVRDSVKAGFAFDLAHMMGAWVHHHVPQGHLLYTDYVEGTLICNQRQQMVDRAIEGKTTHVLFLDSDMRFPPDIIDQLAKHDKDVICANYTTRRDEIVPVTLKLADGEPEHCYTEPEDHGIERIFSAGMGCMLVKTSVFERLSEAGKYPHFMIPWVSEDHTYVGEDIYFCRLLAEHGVEMWVDHQASRFVRHIGSIEYSVAHAVQQRAAREDYERRYHALSE